MTNEIQKETDSWTFIYEGPLNFKDVRNCEICNAIAQNQCTKNGIQHGTTYETNCPTCSSVKHGYCHNHCGIEVALEKHKSILVMTTKAKEQYLLFEKYIESLYEYLDSDLNIYVKASYYVDEPSINNKSELNIEFNVR